MHAKVSFEYDLVFPKKKKKKLKTETRIDTVKIKILEKIYF